MSLFFKDIKENKNYSCKDIPTVKTASSAGLISKLLCRKLSTDNFGLTNKAFGINSR
jgi:hypothetical protein